jgi:CDP-glucose 4,6-dehydratase
VTEFGGAYAGRRVAITGHCGFLGGWAAAWLARLGAGLLGVSRQPERARGVAAPPAVAVDVRDRAALRAAFARFRPELVLHAAAQPLVAYGWKAPAETFDVNLIGTVNVLEAARATSSVGALVLIGSGRPASAPAADPYNASKLAAELVAASFSQKRISDGRERQLRVGVAKPGVAIGGGDSARGRLVPSVIHALEAGEAPMVQTGGEIRPWQHVLDAVSGILSLGAHLLAEGLPRCDYSFGSLDPAAAISVQDLVDLLCGCWSGRPASLVAASGGQGAGGYSLDCHHAQRDLGWIPTWDICAAVEKTVEWYRAASKGTGTSRLIESQIGAFVADARAAEIGWANW